MVGNVIDSDPTPFVRLSQFLDLESRWDGARSEAELADRICRTAAILLDARSVSIGVATKTSEYVVLAATGTQEAEERTRESGLLRALAAKAVSTGLVQIKNSSEDCFCAFPYSIADGPRGAISLVVAKPLLAGSDVAVMKFLASLIGVVLAGEFRESPRPAMSNERAGASVSHSSQNHPEHQGSRAPVVEARKFAAMVAHDLRNPLAVMSGYAELLGDAAFGPLSDEQKRAVSAIARQAKLLEHGIDQVLDIAREDSDEDAVAQEIVMADLFEEITATRFTAEQNERIAWPGPESRFSFTTLEKPLTSVIQNLVQNAFAHGSGTVAVDCTRRNGELALTVSDQGSGLDEETERRLVGHCRDETEPAPTSGIGLLAVAHYVRKMGGRIQVQQAQKFENSESTHTISVQIPPAPESLKNR